jgi:CRP-like cAMP-binding protein
MYLHADLTKTMCRIPWFADLRQDQLESLAGIAALHDMEPGDYLFKEGDREDYLFILLEGQVVLEAEVPTRGHVVVYTAESLDIIGWSSMTPIARQRTASVRATRPSVLLALNSVLLMQLCDEDHDLGYIIMRRLANVVANRFLTTRLCLLDLIANTMPQSSATR